MMLDRIKTVPDTSLNCVNFIVSRGKDDDVRVGFQDNSKLYLRVVSFLLMKLVRQVRNQVILHKNLYFTNNLCEGESSNHYAFRFRLRNLIKWLQLLARLFYSNDR